MKTIRLLLILTIFLRCSFIDKYQYSESTIRLNQLGYLTFSKKQAVFVSPRGTSFKLIDDKEQVVFEGELLSKKKWDKSGEEVAIADFSGFEEPGQYRLIAGSLSSPFFEISENPYQELINSSIKSFYLNRASTALPKQYAGQYQRPLAHPDTLLVVHTSAASDLRPAGYQIQAPYGWYDAGDYNKYVVNSGITTYTLLSAYLHNSSIFQSLQLNIPESENDCPDLLDEILWNIRWMEHMQDPNDGGVYHKTTSANFEGFIPPAKAKAQRFVVAKGTAAALNFAAVMAKASVVLAESQPSYASNLLAKAERAWQWAVNHPDVQFTNPKAETLGYPTINTGEYGDRRFDDEFLWASVELFLATGSGNYLDNIQLETMDYQVPGWNRVESLGLISLTSNSSKVPELVKKQASDHILKLAEKLLADWREAPYRITLQDFKWGSNSVILNQSMILLNAYRIFGNTEFFEAALSGLDYVLGRNATGYCFVTGFGEKSPVNPHHRISATDEVEDPIPGMLVGGPNPRNVHQDCGEEMYPTLLPARCYLDEVCSYSTNEVAINWNAPLVYTVSSIQAIYQKDFSHP